MNCHRKFQRTVSATCATALIALFPALASATDCSALLQQHLQSDLSLPFAEFDQDDSRGWRILSPQGCESETISLIESYVARQEKPHPVLIWHLAQSLAKAARYSEAVAVARKTLRPAESEAQSEFQWNEYVNGTIAFLEGDSESLKRHHDRLRSATVEHPMNRPNFISLSRLQRCFGKPYKQAYSCDAEP